ncbi:MAG: cytochrome P460 family protein [Cytophagales bacterium]
MKNILLVPVLAIFLFACVKNPKSDVIPQTTTNDEDLFSLLSNSDYKFYQNDSSKIVSVAENNAHGDNIVIKFNQKAWQALGADGKLPQNAQFPDSSLIVKETYNGNSQTITFYSAMLKLKNDKNSANGWVWGEYLLSGNVLSSVKNGTSCVPCHSRNGNRDFVRTFDSF